MIISKLREALESFRNSSMIPADHHAPTNCWERFITVDDVRQFHAQLDVYCKGWTLDYSQRRLLDLLHEARARDREEQDRLKAEKERIEAENLANSLMTSSIMSWLSQVSHGFGARKRAESGNEGPNLDAGTELIRKMRGGISSSKRQREKDNANPMARRKLPENWR
jgi:hypothetical protein